MVDSVLVNKPGFGGKGIYYSMVFFKDKLVLAYLGEESWKKMVAKQAIGEIGHEFAGIIGLAASTPIEERLKLKLKQDPSQTLVLNAEEEAQLTDALLKADAKKNYAIHYDQIEKVEVRKSGIRDALIGDSEAAGRITMKIQGKEQRFYLQRSKGDKKFEDAERIIRTYLAAKM